MSHTFPISPEPDFNKMLFVKRKALYMVLEVAFPVIRLMSLISLSARQDCVVNKQTDYL